MCAQYDLRKSEDILKGLYKSASFVAQAVAFRHTGTYFSKQDELLEIASDNEKVIIKTFLQLKNGGEVDFDTMSENLFNWVKALID